MINLSFRDPVSKVFLNKEGVFRKLNSNNQLFFEELFKKNFFVEMQKSNWIQESIIIEKNNEKLIFHKKISNFVETNEMSSYQLFESGLHTLNILINSLKNGYLIKDASAWNIVFLKGKPFFLDVASFEEWGNEKVWLGYGQFVRHYIIPLILNKENGIPISKIFSGNRDGINPTDALKQLGLKVYKSFVYIEFILLSHMFRSRKIKKLNNPSGNPDINKKILLNILERLKKKLIKLEPDSSSFWSNYTKNRKHYSDKDILIKKKIIDEFFKLHKGKVLDIGCNTGEFLNLTSKYCDESHGIDIDENCINFIQKNISNKNISVSNINISNPMPPTGWNNAETKGYLEKNKNYFDTIIFFGIVHHLIVSDRIPLENIIEILLKLTKKFLIFEFISNKDEKFKEIANINLDLYNNFTKENFEKIIEKSFKIIKIYDLEYNSNRFIYILEKLN
tara:strand:+ start:2552 stop:3901 length:1350 start_codon:yes stop_codon:yes gene_type:complete